MCLKDYKTEGHQYGPKVTLNKAENAKIPFFRTFIKNSVFGKALFRVKMSHFVSFFVHFEKLIRRPPGPLCQPPPPPQSQKNPVGVSALPTGKFLRVWKVFARIYKIGLKSTQNKV